MCEREDQGEAPSNTLANSDVIKIPDDLSLSDSDPDEPTMPFDPEVEDLSSSSADEEPGDLGPRQPSIRPTEPAFSLRGGSSSFSSRTKSIFDCLEKAAGLGQEKTTGLSPERPTGPLGKDRVSGLGLEDHLRDGVFARPSPPPPPVPRGGKSGRGVPDYLLHPERWTRYSLEDIPETSDRQNSTVAQQYIHSLQQRKNSSKVCGPEETFVPTFNQGQNSSSQHKIVFSRPSHAQKEDAGDMSKDGARERSTGFKHPDLDEEEEGEGEDVEEGAALSHCLKETERKRKRPQQEEDPGTLKEEMEKPSLGFASFKKINRKNFRKSSKADED
ncbi:protein TSSC4 [Hypomesus transpacificus]|uniref:protein TSSC4 n=1 Tax=Hypomesus transpacificus TaxID=137520 RepID=UPI001F0856B8|nr:protein TSSC4 [Hypomesus transpacificus]XP_046897736.1 protein TSSC4 [Hypomesus transpacificus]XP_046897738.1 protein TSSC4 [Hypomesus transpacificus]